MASVAHALADALDHLLERMVRPPTTSGPSP